MILGPTSEGSPADTDPNAAQHGGPSYRALADDLLSPHAHVVHVSWSPDEPREERTARLDASLADAAALVTMPWLLVSSQDPPVFDREHLSKAPSLRVIAGTHDFRLAWIDLEAAAERGVAVVDTSRSMTPTVAEFGVGITFALLRRIPEAIDVVRRGGWMPPMDGTEHVFRDLADCSVGLAGYGSINRHYRRFIRPYGCAVSTFDPLIDDAVLSGDDVARATSLEELADGSDIFVVAIPPTPSTLRIVDRAVIEQLATGSLFVLLSRMAVVEQDALWERARAGELRVGVDVFDPEPPPADAWFRTAQNVLPTPHIAGNARFAHERCFREACTDVVRVLTGEAPGYAVVARDRGFYEGSIDWVYG
ncbi:MAG: NAD(P)-dependent oxidoreductase [Actinomycetota bacterium]